MTQPVEGELALQMAPSAHVSQEMRQVIVTAFDGASLGIKQWVPLVGEAQVSETTPRVAEPTLLVLLEESLDRPADEVCNAIAPSLARALSRIREELPELPIGIEVFASDGTRWLGFRRQDPPDVVERGARALPRMPRSPGAYGWDDRKGEWSVV